MHAFDVLSDPVRRRILELLADGEQAAGTVVGPSRRSSGSASPPCPSISRCCAGWFASVRPAGARRLYAVSAEPLREVDDWLEPFRQFWSGHLDALGTELARGRRARRHIRQEKEKP